MEEIVNPIKNSGISPTHQQTRDMTTQNQEKIAHTFGGSEKELKETEELTKTVQTLQELGISSKDIITALKEKQKLTEAGITTQDALRNAEIIAEIKNTVKEMIENNSPDIVRFAQGSEGIIYKMKVSIDNIPYTFIAMKKRYDKNATHESAMLLEANNLVVESDRKGFSTPDTRAKVPNYFGPITAIDLENNKKTTEYIIMEYIDGKTLYTLQLEAIIQRMKEKVNTIVTYSQEEYEDRELETFKKERYNKREKELQQQLKRIEQNILSAKKAYTNAPLSAKQKAQAMQKAQANYDKQKEQITQNVKKEYALRGTKFKEKKEELGSKIKERYIYQENTLDEYRQNFINKKIDFADDEQAISKYTAFRDEYFTIMRECKSILKADRRNLPNIYTINTSREVQKAITTEFLKFIQQEKLPIFTNTEVKEIVNRIKHTLEIFHKQHFYHRDLGQNPRNLMLKKENGKLIPYIIDFGSAIKDERYVEGPEIKYDPLHKNKTTTPESNYPKDKEILSFITSSPEEEL